MTKVYRSYLDTKKINRKQDFTKGNSKNFKNRLQFT